MMVIDLKIDVDDAINMVDGYTETIPDGLRRGMWFAMLRIQKELRAEISAQNLIWRGTLHQKTRARKLNKSTYGIFMPIHGIRLDQMKPHFVALKRGRLIRQWYLDKIGKKPIPKALFVKPHPFIDKAILRASQEVKEIIEREINRAIRRKGKR